MTDIFDIVAQFVMEHGGDAGSASDGGAAND
jgi:hypothetical protein